MERKEEGCVVKITLETKKECLEKKNIIQIDKKNLYVCMHVCMYTTETLTAFKSANFHPCPEIHFEDT